MNKLFWFCLLTGLFVPIRASRGDMIVDIQDVTLTSGGKGHVDVYVRSSGTDFVQLANYTFVIAPVAGQSAPGVLKFDPIQSFLDQDSTDPPYVFAGDTDASSLTKSLDGSARLSGFDLTSSSQNVMIDSSNRLLTRLELMHEGAGLQGAFTISLVNDNLLSFFQNASGENVPIEASSFNNPGSITVSITAVPEPSTWLLSVSLMTAFAAQRRLKRTRQP